MAAVAPAADGGLRNSWVLMAAQAINGSSAVMAMTLGGLAGAYLLGPDDSLATLPIAAFQIGVALGAVPAALLMQRIGRRNGLIAGTSVTIIAGLLAALALSLGSFWLFAVAFLAGGVSGAFVQQYRFAAIETAPAHLRGVAVSRVMIGGIITALIAPQIVLYTRNLLDPLPFAGTYVALAIMAVIGIAVLSLLRFPPRDRVVAVPIAGEEARSLSAIMRQPRFIVALVCAATSFALMVFVMTAAPLAMVDHHHTEADAILGIQWHVIAMFAPSLVTGRLIARFGKEAIVSIGLALLIVSAVVGVAGLELLHFWGMLIILGVGWNFSFVGATAMLADTYRPSERGRVEGLNDLIVFGSVAIASLASGAVLNAAGWTMINYIVLPIVVTVLTVLLVFLTRSEPVARAS